MKKLCDNCYYLHKSIIHDVYFCAKHSCTKEKPSDVCDKHDFNCSLNDCMNAAEYKYKDQIYCTDCLLEYLKVEQYTTIEYYRDGEYLGSEDNIVEVIENLDEDITML